MFDLGFQELIVIFLVALLVVGPKKLPELGRTLGRWIIEIRQGIYSAKSQIESEFDDVGEKVVNDKDKKKTPASGEVEAEKPESGSGEEQEKGISE